MPSHIFREVDRGHVNNVRKQLAVNPDALYATTASEGQSPLHRAAALGNGDMIRELLRYKAPFDAVDNYGNTPLHLACQSGSLDAVIALLELEMRSTLRMENRDGQTPLHIAVLVGTREIVRELIAAGAQLDAKDRDGHAPVDLISESQVDLIQGFQNDVNDVSSPGHQDIVKELSPMTPRGNRPASASAFDKQQLLNSAKNKRLKHLSSSPDKGYARFNDPTHRSLPRKQLQLHEMAIQGLQSELTDLGFRADNIEHFLNESQANFDKLETLSASIESQDRQLAELDQRLKFQEAHLRDLRPRINSIGDESRHNKEQSSDLREMVEHLRETARSSLGSVLARVQEWEAATINLKEQTKRQSQAEEGQQIQIDNLEKQIIDAHRLVKEAKAAAEKSAQLSLGLEQGLQEIRDRLSAMEDFMKETTAITEESVAEEEDSETRRQLNDLMEKYAALKSLVYKTANQTDRIEEMYKEQSKIDEDRRKEQEMEMSQREAKILELRRVALEEENQRRDFAAACEQQGKQLDEFKAEVGEAVSLCKKEASDRSALESKIKVMEAELEKMYNRLLESENKVKKGGCCVIS